MDLLPDGSFVHLEGKYCMDLLPVVTSTNPEYVVDVSLGMNFDGSGASTYSPFLSDVPPVKTNSARRSNNIESSSSNNNNLDYVELTVDC